MTASWQGWPCVVLWMGVVGACSSERADVGPQQNSEPAPSGDGVSTAKTSERPSSSNLLGRFWGYGTSSRALVVEVFAAEDGRLKARGFTGGLPIDLGGSIGVNKLTVGLHHDFFEGCTDFTLAEAGDRLECDDPNAGVRSLHRSKALRVYDNLLDDTGALRPAPFAVGFDADGARFVFAQGNELLVWDSTRKTLGMLGVGERLGVVFANDGRHVAYLRRGPEALSLTADLMLFDGQSGETTQIATHVPHTVDFAHFSPDGAQLVYAANHDAGQGQIMVTSVQGRDTRVIAPGANDPMSPDVIFGPSQERFVFGFSQDGFGSQLSVYDVVSQEVTLLAERVTDLTPSPTGAFVGFSNEHGETIIWDDAAGDVRVLANKVEGLEPDSSYKSGLNVSADGRLFVYLDVRGRAYVYDTLGQLDNPLGTGGALCYSQADNRSRAGHVSSDGSGLIHWPLQSPVDSDCGHTPSTAFTWLGFDGSLTRGTVLGTRSIFGPHGEVLTDTNGVTFWSKERGEQHVLTLELEELPSLAVGPTFARDATIIVFDVVRSSPADTRVFAYDVAQAELTEITTAPSETLRYYTDVDSGQVVYSNEGALKLWAPGPTVTTLLDETQAVVTSEDATVFAVYGKRGTDQGIFTFGFADTTPRLAEAGSILGVTQTHVYFQAVDGLFELAL